MLRFINFCVFIAGGMLAGPTYTRDMGEGSRLHTMPARVPTLGLPEAPAAPPSHHYKEPVSPSYDLNKNLSTRKDKSNLPHPTPSHLHLQPFTGPWLSEVARITPLQPPDHVSFPRTSLQTSSGHSVHGEYYQQYSRTNLYHPAYMSHHFIRDYPRPSPPHPSLRPYHHSSLDPRLSQDKRSSLTSTAPVRPQPTVNHRGIDLELTTSRSSLSSTHPSLAAPIPLIRPLGPPPPPTVSIDSPRDPRDYRERDVRDHIQDKSRLRPPDLHFPISPGNVNDHSPRGIHGESSPKKRHSEGSSFPLPSPKSPRINSKSTLKEVKPFSEIKDEPILKDENRSESPYHPHFRRGALVTVGGSVRKVEDMKTEDFVVGAQTTDHLALDPSSVAAIIIREAPQSCATITFSFTSRKQEVS